MKTPAVIPEKIALDNILAVMDGEYFGKDLSARIVGGKMKLVRLIEEGKIEMSKPSNTQNGKWFCKASQVLRHCRRALGRKQLIKND